MCVLSLCCVAHRCWGWEWLNVTSGRAAVTVWEQATPTVAGVLWRTGKKQNNTNAHTHAHTQFLFPTLSIYPVNCPQTFSPSLPGLSSAARENIIQSNYHMFWCHGHATCFLTQYAEKMSTCLLSLLSSFKQWFQLELFIWLIDLSCCSFWSNKGSDWCRSEKALSLSFWYF